MAILSGTQNIFRRSVSVNRLLRFTLISSIIYAVATGVTVLLSITFQNTLLLTLGLVSMGLLLMTGLIYITLAFVLSR